jgi:NADH-quinone oxidoreductase subunit L
VKAVWLLAHELPSAGQLTDVFFDAPWIAAGDMNVAAGLMLDHLSAVMVLVVTGVGFLIHVYSSSYMEHDEGYTRFFGYLNLFMAAMLILVLGDSMLVTFVGWEGVGLCSYLLIGFWFDKDANALAGRKAFVVNRVGDFAFLLGMFLLFGATGTLKYDQFSRYGEQLHTLWYGQPIAYFAGILILIGATGKSAQIPLYVWLPDAMAGPTPVSALIHAATMVTAGVYVIARMHFVFEVLPVTLAAVAFIGALTALFAATIGIAQRDLKKVLAYSTISQLGFMFAGVGSHLHATSNYQGGIFHLVTHAFFKAGLFLGAGSVMHALAGEGDITRMGGLKHKLPHTRWTFLLCCLAIAGFPGIGGFWSKDAILAGAHASLWPNAPTDGPFLIWMGAHLGMVIYVMLLVAAFCTAFYMFRLYFLVFEGEFRGTEEQEHHLHESPPAMTVVLWILALGSIVVAFTGVPDAIHEHSDRFGEWLQPILPAQLREESAGEFFTLAGIASVVGLAGIALAWVLYGHGFSARVRAFVAAAPRLYKTVLNKYYVDEFYDFIIVRPLRWTALILWKAVDTFVIDLFLVNGIGLLVGGVGKLVKYVQNGDVQRYVIGILLGTATVFWFAIAHTSCEGAEFTARVEGRDVIVDAAGAGLPGKRLQYRIDWEGGKNYGAYQSGTVFKHHYDSAGVKKIRVQAADPRWGWTHNVTNKVVVK